MEHLQLSSEEMQAFTIKMSTNASLSEIKKNLPGDVAKQVRNVSMFNMCTEDHFPNETSCITFAQGLGLVASNQSQILHCKGRFCLVMSDCTKKMGYMFRCYNKKPKSKYKCLATISPLNNTFFENSHLTMNDIFKVVMCFVSQLTLMQVTEQLGISKETVIGRYMYCREVCEVILANEFQEKMGGEGMIVEVDDSDLSEHKYAGARKRKWEDKWLLDCYCRDTKQSRTVCISDKNRSTIFPLLLNFIDKQSTIVSGLKKVYKGCEKYGFCAYKSLSDKRYFVCPTDNDDNTNLEPTRRWRKRRALSRVDYRHLAEDEYRRRYFHDMDMAPLPLDDKFLLFLYHISLVYPGPCKVGMTFPALDDVDDEDRSETNEPDSEEGVDLSDDFSEDSDMEPPLKKISSPISA